MHKSHRKVRSAFTLVEMILVIGMMAIITLAMVGMVRATHENWQTASGRSAVLLDGQAVIQQMGRILRQAKAVTDVSESADPAGFITFTAVDDTTEEFRLDTTTGELRYGDPNALQVLAAPVSSLVFTCYDVGLQVLTGPVAVADIRTVEFEATFVSPEDTSVSFALAGRVFIPTVAATAEETGGGVLFVAADSASLTAQETARKALVESFGYTVSLISDDASQAVFDAAIADNDVAYVSEQVSDTALGTKLTNATIGVVNEEAGLVDDFGMASANPTPVTLMVTSIVDNTHYITSPFNLEDIALSNSGQPFTYFNSGVAAGVEVLGQVFSKSSLMVADAGDELINSATAAGRRVKLPWGSSGFDFNALNSDGRTIMQRAIEWAAGATTPAPQTILLVVGNATTMSTKDAARKTLMEGWGYIVTVIDDGESQANFDTAAAANDVVYVSGTIGGGTLLDKLTGSPTPIVDEFPGKLDNFGFCNSTTYTFNADTFAKSDPAHYISSPFGGSSITILTTFMSLPTLGGTLAPDLQVPAGFTDFELGVVTLDAGATRYDNNPAPNRRVFLPFAPAEVSQMTADAQTLMQRAIEWAADGAGGGSEPEPDLEMYVHDITMSWRKQGPRYYGQATVWVKDENGDDVEAATVSGTWSGSVSGTDSGDTAADGTVMIESSGVNGGGTYIFTVDSITKDGFVYNAALNVESSGMIVAP